MTLFNQAQIDEMSYQQRQKQLLYLAEVEPDDMYIELPQGETAIIARDPDTFSEYVPTFENVDEFLAYRLKELGNDINRLAIEMGYDGTPNWTRTDFIIDLLNEEDKWELIRNRYDARNVSEVVD